MSYVIIIFNFRNKIKENVNYNDLISDSEMILSKECGLLESLISEKEKDGIKDLSNTNLFGKTMLSEGGLDNNLNMTKSM